jgi:hypothetical protein
MRKVLEHATDQNIYKQERELKVIYIELPADVFILQRPAFLYFSLCFPVIPPNLDLRTAAL